MYIYISYVVHPVSLKLSSSCFENTFKILFDVIAYEILHGVPLENIHYFNQKMTLINSHASHAILSHFNSQ